MDRRATSSLGENEREGAIQPRAAPWCDRFWWMVFRGHDDREPVDAKRRLGVNRIHHCVRPGHLVRCRCFVGPVDLVRHIQGICRAVCAFGKRGGGELGRRKSGIVLLPPSPALTATGCLRTPELSRTAPELRVQGLATRNPIQRSSLMKPAPQLSHRSSRPRATMASRSMPWACMARTSSRVSISIPW